MACKMINRIGKPTTRRESVCLCLCMCLCLYLYLDSVALVINPIIGRTCSSVSISIFVSRFVSIHVFVCLITLVLGPRPGHWSHMFLCLPCWTRWRNGSWIFIALSIDSFVYEGFSPRIPSLSHLAREARRLVFHVVREREEERKALKKGRVFFSSLFSFFFFSFLFFLFFLFLFFFFIICSEGI